MKLEDLLERRIPLAITVALLLQAGTAIWWAASKDTAERFETQHIAALESALDRTADGQTQMIDRLARIEERVSAQSGALDRIEKRLGNSRR